MSGSGDEGSGLAGKAEPGKVTAAASSAARTKEELFNDGTLFITGDG
jgi:hypothetical protein